MSCCPAMSSGPHGICAGWQGFHMAEGLAHKVRPEGGYASFSGAMAVFRRKKQELRLLHLMQQVLNQALEAQACWLLPCLRLTCMI